MDDIFKKLAILEKKLQNLIDSQKQETDELVGQVGEMTLCIEQLEANIISLQEQINIQAQLLSEKKDDSSI